MTMIKEEQTQECTYNSVSQEQKLMDRCLVLGRGFLGRCFERNGFTVIGRDKLNIEKMEDIKLLSNLDEFKKADYVINCIGISDTRMCEDKANWHTVHFVNGLLPEQLSFECLLYGKKLTHISTGCLYESTDGLKSEDSPLETHCNYTVSKIVGELGCSEFDLIIRPRLLFDSVQDPKNLLTKFGKFTKFLNEFNTVTSNQTIVEATIALLKANQSGPFNVGNTGTYTIAQLAEAFGADVEDTLQQRELIDNAGIYLVNNVMDLSKLQKYYNPRDAVDEIKEYAKCLK